MNCPSCETELIDIDGKPPKTCAKCGFRLENWPGFLQWFRTAAKMVAQERKQEKPPKPKDSDDDPLSGLMGF